MKRVEEEMEGKVKKIPKKYDISRFPQRKGYMIAYNELCNRKTTLMQFYVFYIVMKQIVLLTFKSTFKVKWACEYCTIAIFHVQNKIFFLIHSCIRSH